MKIKRKVFGLEIKEKYQLQEIKKNKPRKKQGGILQKM